MLDSNNRVDPSMQHTVQPTLAAHTCTLSLYVSESFNRGVIVLDNVFSTLDKYA